MPIEVKWDDEDRTRVIIRLLGSYTWDELHIAYDQVWAMVKSQSHSVHLLNDVGKGKTMPSTQALGHYRKINSKKPANLGLTAVIGLDGFGKMLSEVYIKSTRREARVMYVATVEEAREKLPVITPVKAEPELATAAAAAVNPPAAAIAEPPSSPAAAEPEPAAIPENKPVSTDTTQKEN